MFSSARIGAPAATEPTSGMPLLGRTTLTTLSTPVIRSSIARGFDGSRLRSPSFSRFARCAWTVDDECRPTALPISRTVGGEPVLAAYLRMKSKISFCLLVRSRSTIVLSVFLHLPCADPDEHLFAEYPFRRTLAMHPTTAGRRTSPNP